MHTAVTLQSHRRHTNTHHNNTLPVNHPESQKPGRLAAKPASTKARMCKHLNGAICGQRHDADIYNRLHTHPIPIGQHCSCAISTLGVQRPRICRPTQITVIHKASTAAVSAARHRNTPAATGPHQQRNCHSGTAACILPVCSGRTAGPAQHNPYRRDANSSKTLPAALSAPSVEHHHV